MEDEYVYLIGIIYPFGELNIMGIYTDKRMLIEAYEKLIREDERCVNSKYQVTPQIYKLPINKFLGEKLEWVKNDEKSSFYSERNIEPVSIEEIRSHVKITSFCGLNVYCDLDFSYGDYIDLEYVGGGEGDYCWIRMSIEDGSFNVDKEYLQATLESWYQDNKSYLMEIYQTRRIVVIPEW